MIDLGCRVMKRKYATRELESIGGKSGESNVGTVVKIGQGDDQATPEKTVVVQWDHGGRTNYKVGNNAVYDLVVFDSAPAGVRHNNKICDGCKRQEINGIRWQCSECDNYNLCTDCYMSDKHSLDHSFKRYLNPACKGFAVPKRSIHSKTMSSGIFAGARVVRGSDWIWRDQDNENIGTVIEIRGWEKETSNSAASVKWDKSKQENTYRVGHKGKMDLKCIKPAPGQYVYEDHLPIFGKDYSDYVQTIAQTLLKFKVGDRVKVSLNAEKLKKLQQGHGGWNPKMSQLIGKVGKVHRITQAGDVRVQYNGGESERSESNRWTFHPDALQKVTVYHDYSIHDSVRVISDVAKVRSFQSQEHGNWHNKMAEVIGKVGTVVEVYGDGDVRVQFESKRIWTFNNACVVPCDNETSQSNATTSPSIVQKNLPVLSSTNITEAAITKEVISEALKGNCDRLRKILSLHPEVINTKHNNITALQLSAHEGNTEILRLLLGFNADATIQDNCGATALHYAVYAHKAECIPILVKHNVDINAINSEGLAAIHIASKSNDIESMKHLLAMKCDVNIQNNNGDTAGHIIASSVHNEVAALLFSEPTFNPFICNLKSFNVFHEASKKGAVFMIELLLEKFPSILSSAKNDGFTALHLSALNGHYELLKSLMQRSGCDINATDKENQTALHVACSQGDVNVVSLLVKEGASIKITTSKKNTCLHAALSAIPAQINKTDMLTPADLKCMFIDNYGWNEIKHSLKSCIGRYPKKMFKLIAVGCFLVLHGASLRSANSDNLTPLDLIEIPDVIKLLKSIKLVRQNRNVDKEFALMSNTKITQQSNNDILFEDYSVLISPNKTTSRQCISCEQEVASVTFYPCQHTAVCIECSRRMRRCMKCHNTIEKKIHVSGKEIDLDFTDVDSTVVKLKKRVLELQESNQCSICMERERDVALQCGHRFCSVCPATLCDSLCPICRRPILDTIKLY